jgi:hypothetical protein
MQSKRFSTAERQIVFRKIILYFLISLNVFSNINTQRALSLAAFMPFIVPKIERTSILLVRQMKFTAIRSLFIYLFT